MNDVYIELEELFDVFTEIEARCISNNLVISEYQNLSWIELCNKGIELLKLLRDE